MMTGCSLVLALMAAEPGASRLEVEASGDVGFELRTAAGSALSAQQVYGDGTISLTTYLNHALLDTDDPLSLQPFLQRTTTLRVSGYGGSIEYPQSAGVSDSRGSATVSTGIYAGRFVHLGASVGFLLYRQEVTLGPIPGVTIAPLSESATTWQLPISVSVGPRLDDLLVELTYTVDPTWLDGQWRAPFGAGLGISGRWVIDRDVDLSASARLIDGGARGTAGVEIFTSRTLGFFVDGFGGRGRYYFDGTNAASFAGVDLGFAAWHSRFFGASLSYNFTWAQDARPVIYNQLTLSLFSRPR